MNFVKSEIIPRPRSSTEHMARSAQSPSTILNIVVMLVSLAYCKKLQYSWPPETGRFDYMVGVSLKRVPLCSGALFYPHYAVTAATPFRYNEIPHGDINHHGVRAHVIHRTWNKSVEVLVISINYQIDSYGYNLKTFGGHVPFSPVYDIAMLSLDKQIPSHAAALNVRHPIIAFSHIETIQSSGTFTVLGHGYADRLHVEQNVDLEAVDYPVDSVLVDCDEWVPRTWGQFICISNVDNFVGVASGGVLEYNGVVVGIGSFSMTRGGETILAFTDRMVLQRFHVFITDPPVRPPMW